jgi:protein SCO1/2
MKHLHKATQRALLNRLTLGLLVCVLTLVPAQAQEKGPHHGSKTSPTSKQRPQAKDVAYYSCPMHPTVRAKSAGKCPKCGMDLRAVGPEEAVEVGVASNNAGAPASNAQSAETAETPTGQFSKMNIPDTEVLDQNGRKIHFYTDLVKGQTVAINFIFTTCTTICPPLGATFARVQKELGDRVGHDVRLISISIDPATDTPERLKAWGAKFHAGDGWTFVTGNKPQVDELLRALGASSARREDHSPTVLIGNDARGSWTRAYGLAKPSQLVQIINDAIVGKIAPTPTEASNQ